MTAPTTVGNVSQLCRDLDAKSREYDVLTVDRANAEVDFKATRARRILQARSDGAKSIAEAETIAAADPAVESLWRTSLVADAMVDAAQKAIYVLRERINFGRTVLANERAADTLHGHGVGGAA
jgi:hypothetical protein